MIGVSGQAINGVVNPSRWVVRVTLLQQINELLDQFTFFGGLTVSGVTAVQKISGLPCDCSAAVQAAVIVRPRMFPVERTAPRRLR